MKNGKLSKSEAATLRKALSIVSDWSAEFEADAEEHGYGPDTDTAYVQAMNAAVGLGEFLYEIGL